MRTFLRTAVLSLVALTLTAAPVVAQSEFEKKRDAKLGEDWVTSNGWTSDYDEARKQAKESGKVIFTYFTRSYAY